MTPWHFHASDHVMHICQQKLPYSAKAKTPRQSIYRAQLYQTPKHPSQSPHFELNNSRKKKFVQARKITAQRTPPDVRSHERVPSTRKFKRMEPSLSSTSKIISDSTDHRFSQKRSTLQVRVPPRRFLRSEALVVFRHGICSPFSTKSNDRPFHQNIIMWMPLPFSGRIRYSPIK